MSGSNTVYLAADFGASSGRLVAGLYDGGRIQLEDVARFPNGGVRLAGRLHWDLPALWQNLLHALGEAAQRYGDHAKSIGVDTWGVDFGLISQDDELLGNPLHYRDQGTDGILETAFQTLPRDKIYEATGLQFMQFNSLYQLLAMQARNSTILQAADRLLMIPDLFHWLLTGEKVNEYTNATTTQMLDPRTGAWSPDILNAFGLPAGLLGEPTQPGAQLGGVRREIADATGFQSLQVVLPGTHDTASAVMAVPAGTGPAERPTWCYISSGTWSLMGVELTGPIITDESAAWNFTNEGGVGGSIRFSKNIAGLWLLQECRRIWSRETPELTWDELVAMAQQAPPAESWIDPDHPRFVAPADMPAEIVAFCRETGQSPPASRGEIARCALESLALRYRWVLQCLERLTGGSIETIHIVGGGAQNRLLNQMAADACNRTVAAGPSEATALGNVLVQLIASGQLTDAVQARQLVRASFAVDSYSPAGDSRWDDAFARFTQLLT